MLEFKAAYSQVKGRGLYRGETGHSQVPKKHMELALNLR